jgi:hypothetical protein
LNEKTAPDPQAENIPLNRDFTPEANVKIVSDWLQARRRKYSNHCAVMYHAAKKDAPILKEGLLAGTGRRKNFHISESGFVYLATSPQMAEMFGSMAYNGHFLIYEIIVPIRKLLPDKKRLEYTILGKPKGSQLAQSLVYGGSARVRGNIERWQIKPHEREEKIA